MFTFHRPSWILIYPWSAFFASRLTYTNTFDYLNEFKSANDESFIVWISYFVVINNSASKRFLVILSFERFLTSCFLKRVDINSFSCFSFRCSRILFILMSFISLAASISRSTGFHRPCYPKQSRFLYSSFSLLHFTDDKMSGFASTKYTLRLLTSSQKSLNLLRLSGLKSDVNIFMFFFYYWLFSFFVLTSSSRLKENINFFILVYFWRTWYRDWLLSNCWETSEYCYIPQFKIPSSGST